MKRHTFTVSQVAALAHLTVRALHHYDEIGLLRPSQRSPAGYRLYDENDLQRLRKVLLFRELGFSLDAVRGLLDANAAQQREALLAQRAVIEQERRHAEAVLRAVDATLDSLKEQAPMTTDKLFEGFDRFENGEYAREAEQRWGNTDAWKESRRRVQALTDADRTAIEEEQTAFITDLLAARNVGHATDSTVAAELAERHRLYIDQRFYPCSHAMQLGLADMYEADARFRDYYDRHGEGLTDYLVAAIRANAAVADK
jgi:MerR family transcriptional regulator, thiopeptide resistance regulator